MAGRIGVGPADFHSLTRVSDGARVVGIGPNDFNNVARVDVGGTDTIGPDEKNPENLVVPAVGSTTFTDDFNRADNVSLGVSWTKVSGSGTIGIVANRASATGVASTYSAPSVGSPNQFAQAAYAGTGSRLICSMTDANNYVGFLYNMTIASMQIIARVAAVNTNYLVPASEPASGAVLELRILNSRATAFVDGAPVPGLVSISVSAVPQANLAGMQSVASSVVFDSFACGTTTL